jgi:hypothetical protein
MRKLRAKRGAEKRGREERPRRGAERFACHFPGLLADLSPAGDRLPIRTLSFSYKNFSKTF